MCTFLGKKNCKKTPKTTICPKTTVNVSRVVTECPLRHYTLYLKVGKKSIWPSPCAFFPQAMVTTSSLVLREI